MRCNLARLRTAPKLEVVSVALEPELKQRLIERAEEAGMTLSAYGAECLRIGLSWKVAEGTRRYTNGTSYDART